MQKKKILIKITYSVIKAAFHKIVANVAEKIVVPTHHWPPERPFWNTESSTNAAIPIKYSNYK